MLDKVDQVFELLNHYPQYTTLIESLQFIKDTHDKVKAGKLLLNSRNIYREFSDVFVNFLLTHDVEQELVDGFTMALHGEVMETEGPPNVRQQFELDVRRRSKKISLARDENGKYTQTNPTVNLAFQLYRAQSFRLFSAKYSSIRARGPFYIARKHDNGSLEFANPPQEHRHYLRALDEAKRLTDKHNCQFVLVSQIGLFDPKDL